MSLYDDAVGRDLLATFAVPASHVVLWPASPPPGDEVLTDGLAVLAESLQERREAYAAAAALLGLRVELGPLELTTDRSDPNAVRVTATQSARLRRG